MDTDQQVRLNFLEESVEYFEQMEQVLLGFETAENKAQQMDIALRAAHSIKGSAGMMGFTEMAQVAHRLEDFFKILRARQIPLDSALETWLLQGVDGLKAVRQLLVEDQPVEQAWLEAHIDPIFAQLQARLGDVSADDENRLLAGEEEIDIALLIFNSGVEEVLDKFTAEQVNLEDEALRQGLIATASQLSNLGLMGEIDSFVALCASIQVEAAQVASHQLRPLVEQAIQLLQRSQALVQLGRLENLPEQFKFQPGAEIPADAGAAIAAPAASENAPQWAGSSVEAEQDRPEIELSELQKMQAEMERLLADPTGLSAAANDFTDAVDAIDAIALPLAELSQLQDAIAHLQPQAVTATVEVDSALIPAIANPPAEPLPASAAKRPFAATPAQAKRPVPRVAAQRSATLRIAAADLHQINSLFSTLILERNAINLRQRQLTGFAQLLQERMESLSSFNLRLRQWYDRASMEGLVQQNSGLEVAALAGPRFQRPSTGNFDSLEMDQYSDLHLMAQEQMETVVQLQEVTADIMLGLQEMGQVTQKLNGTTRSLQERITRTQMRPFSEVVGRFPRVIRDLSVQYDKKVDLSISGENTLFERVALEALADPLNHLLRNCFDHGLGSAEERLAAGKLAEGQIRIQAFQQGNQAQIVISDDGRGINLERIRAKVRQHGIPEEHIAQMGDRDLLSLIFDAGFSTAEKVTELSGRGVGMDVVRANIEKLKGDIQVDTQLGQGTQFTITLPLSLSVFRIVLLEQRKAIFAVPVDAVTEMLICKPDTIIQPADGAPYILWNGAQVPVVDLGDRLACQGNAPSFSLEGHPSINHPLLIVVQTGDRHYAVPIDRYWNEQEVALRPVLSPMPLPTGFSGATILEDGRVVPLVSLQQLVQVKLEQAGAAIAAKPGQETDRIAAIASQASAGIADRSRSDISLSEVWHGASGKQVVLVIDDSVHARRYLTLTLEKAGYEVEQAKDGQEGVDRLRDGLRVQAVLCDVEMPRLDGYGFLDAIRSQPEFATLPITMLTSRNSEKHRKLAMGLGASAYFSKPYNEQELLKALEGLIQKS